MIPRCIRLLAGLDIVPADATSARPFQDCHTGQLRAVVGDAHLRLGFAPGNGGIQLSRHAGARQRRIGDERQALAGAVIYNHHDAELGQSFLSSAFPSLSARNRLASDTPMPPNFAFHL